MASPGLLLLVLGAACVLLALRGAVAYDFARYAVIGGFAASRGTWLLVAGGAGIALLGLIVRREVLPIAALASTLAAACLTIALAWTVHTTPQRRDPVRHEQDCRDQNIGIGCRLHQLLDALEPGPPPAAPSRAWLILALSAHALISSSVLIRARRRAQHRA
ncbi:MAG: hypothetical protein M3680_12785 [Myxococcota bacterium]|nr:hypothetical protein [Myxococcota bacterium]